MDIAFSIRRAARSLFRYPGISVLSVLALGLGIGLPTAMFSMVDAAILRGLPVADPAKLMHLERRRIGTSGEGLGAAARDYVGWSEQQRSFSALAAYRTGTSALRSAQSVDRVGAAWLTPNAFALLGVNAAVGRTFGENDVRPDASSPVVLSWHVWRDNFASDRSVIGRSVTVDGESHTVIGVMPQSFRFPYGQDLWLPMTVTQVSASDSLFPQVDVFGKLNAGVNRSEAKAEFAVIAQRMAQRYPTTNTSLEVTVKPFAERFMGEIATTTMYVMLGAVLLVLIVACSNVANLLLVRAVHRSRDIAISVALGASRQRIIVQILLESAMLAIIGGALGIAIASGGITFLSRSLSSFMPYWAEPRLDASVILFAFALAVAAAVLAGVVPAFRTTATDLTKTLRDDSRGSTSAKASRVMQGLIVVELALSMGLLVATGLLSQGARHARNVQLGFSTASLFTARVSLDEQRTAEQRVQYFNALEARLQNESQIAAVGLVSTLPGTHAARRRMAIDGVEYKSRDDMPAVLSASASSSFFTALNIVPIKGRVFTTQDVSTSDPVIVVNARFAERYLQGTDPIGKRIRLGTAPDAPTRTIVGVVPNLWMGAFDALPDHNPPGYYVPIAQSPPSSVAIVAQTRGSSPLAATDAVRAAAFSVNPEVPLHEVRDIPKMIEEGTWFYGMGAGILAVCGATALLLATIGVYGVIAFSVGRRKREFGVRMALGAAPSSIIRLVLRRGVWQVALGLSFGVVLAVGLASGVQSLLFDVSPTDPRVYMSVGLTLACVAAVAMLLPALAASRTQPNEALRSD